MSDQQQINESQTNQTNKWYQTTLGIILIVILVFCILSGIVYVVYLKFFQKEGLQDSNDISNAYEQPVDYTQTDFEVYEPNYDIPMTGANSNIYTVENESSFVTNFLEMNAQEAKEIILTQYGDIITQVNIIPLNAIVTADYRVDRVRLFVDDANVVKKVNAPGIPEIEGSSPVQTTPTVEAIPSSSKNSNVYEVDEPSSPQISIEPYVVSDWRDVSRDNNADLSLLMDDVKIETQYRITLSGKKLPNTKIILPYGKEIEEEITIDQFLQSPRLHCFKQVYDDVGVQGGYFKDINTGEKYIKKVHDKDTYLDHAFFTYTPSEFVEMINGKPTIQAELHIKEVAPTDLKFIFLALTNGPYEPGASCYQEPVTPVDVPDVVYLKFFQKEGLQDSNDNDAEQKLINRLDQKMSHKGYRCYAKSRVAGSLSGPRQLANGDCNRRNNCSCKKINCGARNNVKTQVLALLSENEITQDQADRFITNLDLNHSNCV